jgi:hypothetical protein
MSRFLNWLVELLMKRSKKPWARFITSGIDDEGQVRFDMAWNKAFLRNIAQYGFDGESEEICVQNFLWGSMMLPKSIFDDDEVSSAEHPNLQSEKNQFRR